MISATTSRMPNTEPTRNGGQNHRTSSNHHWAAAVFAQERKSNYLVFSWDGIPLGGVFDVPATSKRDWR
jgi:hypothetical protein